jgi:hypothetical protein
VLVPLRRTLLHRAPLLAPHPWHACENPYLDTNRVSQSSRKLQGTATRGGVRALKLLIYADCPLEHRIGLLTLVANRLEHARCESIELALDSGLGA